MGQKRALITGISGQDGSYLAELLLSKGYEVHGIVRKSTLEVKERLRNLSPVLDRLQLHASSIENHLSLYKLISEIEPDECYHLAASSFVSYDFDDEASIININFNSTHFLLSCLKELSPQCRFYFAGSSEMFGHADSSPQNETTRFNPRSIYGISKLSSYHVVKNYREYHKMFACTGISYNHESPRRGLEYVTRKISSTAAKIFLGLADHLELGNLNAQRDWGYAPSYVEAMWRMLNQSERPQDFVLATGQTHTIEELLKIAFENLDLDYKKYVRTDSKFFRPSEDTRLVGDASKARKLLDWQCDKSFETMIREMVDADLKRLKNQANSSN